MISINPKKFKAIKNKAIPNPLRPKFRNKAQANIYFLSQRKVKGEKKDQFKQKFKIEGDNKTKAKKLINRKKRRLVPKMYSNIIPKNEIYK